MFQLLLCQKKMTKLLEQLKSGFKRTIKWNKYKSQITVQPQNNNLNYLIDPTFTNNNRLFVLLFTRNNAGDNRDTFSQYYLPNVEIKDFNVLLVEKVSLGCQQKMKMRHTRKSLKCVTMTPQLVIILDFAYFKENYKLITIDLSKQTKLKDPQQINLIGEFENQAHGATIFFIIEKSEETTFNCLQNSITII